MTQEDGSGTMNWLWRALCILLFIAFIAGIMQSCGARKAQVDISKSSDIQKEQNSSKGSVSQSTDNSGESSSSQQNNKTKENVSTKVVETFDSTGRVKSRTTETKNKKSTDKSQKQESRSYIIKINTDSVFNNTVYKTNVVTRYVKSKDTDANNNALYWTIFGSIGIIAILFLIYKLITKK